MPPVSLRCRAWRTLRLIPSHTSLGSLWYIFCVPLQPFLLYIDLARSIASPVAPWMSRLSSVIPTKQPAECSQSKETKYKHTLRTDEAQDYGYPTHTRFEVPNTIRHWLSVRNRPNDKKCIYTCANLGFSFVLLSRNTKAPIVSGVS